MAARAKGREQFQTAVENRPRFDGESRSQPSRRYRTTSARYEIQLAVLRQQVAALQTALERERERRQAVVDRYERILQTK